MGKDDVQSFAWARVAAIDISMAFSRGLVGVFEHVLAAGIDNGAIHAAIDAPSRLNDTAPQANIFGRTYNASARRLHLLLRQPACPLRYATLSPAMVGDAHLLGPAEDCPPAARHPQGGVVHLDLSGK
jgi:hypothetical protein